ncbi:MAG TPA: metallophosphoesterase [Kofleriaceae bacterium]|nr:metallophosphoesterase [Kofleriaceae bacterium]
MRATWLTDTHLNFLRPLALRQFYDRVKDEQPEALLVTGDIAESDSVVRFVDELGAHTGAPVYFVLGNHDYYRSSIRIVRDLVQRAPRHGKYLPAGDPIQITERTVMLGVDGWGDARCGDLSSTVQLSDWNLIEDFRRVRHDRAARCELLQRLGANEGRALREQLARVPPGAREVLVLTHVPPFPGACIYGGQQSDSSWLPWFTCISTGEALADFADAHPETEITVLCGHSHGIGTCRPWPNLEIRTGGWPPGVDDYGNPLVQATLEI